MESQHEGNSVQWSCGGSWMLILEAEQFLLVCELKLLASSLHEDI